ncbi:hypothetical protein QBC33DRAFT_547062 [Phialemonium atrogriseum]|uniref:Uncharacterized protein n=1 Tax=Phialemonium atrogriseum TaxID=1093897 RepID=A0AAJ0FJF8_9PEZI|nr:uncharacterized protein QBC33DRAFT_547062 [Phialemonium atrogriseum]KAK1764384.1 hypothetical protein QBC33DRAFT_547062 [Phialemonium atrogriseum]
MLTYSLIAASTLSTAAAAYPVNAYNGYGPDVLCVYPLSGAYAPLQRILYYALLAYGVLGRRQPWLVTGALASSMSYGGAAAIHSVVLVTRARSQYALDLDIYGVFAITSAGVMLTAPLLAFSTTLRTVGNEVRTIIMLWASLMLLGAILAVCAIYAKDHFMEAPTCLPPGVTVLSAAASLLESPTDNCTYACFPQEHPLLRRPTDIMAWPNKTDPAQSVTGVFLPTLSSAIPLALIYLVTYLIRKRRGDPCPATNHATSPPGLARLELGWIGDWLRRRRHDRASSAAGSPARAQGRADRRFKFRAAFQYYCVLVSFGAFVANTILNEVRLQPLPADEMPYEVGQWAPWVSVLLVVVAQIINHFSGKRRRRESMRDEEGDICARQLTGSTLHRQSTVGSGEASKDMAFELRRSDTGESDFKRRNSF